MSKKILLIGSGGHCKSVLDSILSENNYSDIGIIERKGYSGEGVLGIPIVGFDEELERLYHEGFTHAFVTVGSIGEPSLRMKIIDNIEKIGFEIPNIIDCSATISNYANFEKGIFVGKNAVINAGSSIHKGAIINTGAVIEHDCVIEAFSHVSSGTVLCGQVRVCSKTHIGANSVVKQQVSIGLNTIIGMGSVVLKDIGDNVVAFGNPCVEYKENS